MNQEKDFQRFKNLVYNNVYVKYSFNEFALFLTKSSKSEKEIKMMKSMHEYTKLMKQCIQDLGTTVALMNSQEFKETSEEYLKIDDEHLKDVIMSMDTFIDSMIALSRVFWRGQTKFILKKSSTYLKAIRGKFIQKASEFKIRVLSDDNERNVFKQLMNETIDIFLKEAYSLRITILSEKIEKVLKDDTKHSNN